MKRLISLISMMLMLVFVVTSANAVIITGGVGERASYTVQHFIETNASPENVLYDSSKFNSYIGVTTKAESLQLLGYTPNPVKQQIIDNTESTVVDIYYAMDGEYAAGDVNCDNNVDMLDMAMLKRSLAGWNGYDATTVCLYSSDYNRDGETMEYDSQLLLSLLADVDTPSAPTGRVKITFAVNGNFNSYDLTPGDPLYTPADILVNNMNRYKFDGWYDSDFTTKHTTVPETETTLYAKFDDYLSFTFNGKAVYNPNNVKDVDGLRMVEPVDNPWGEGTVMYSRIINVNDRKYYGYYRGIVPTACDGVGSPMVLEKNRTYNVSFNYRFADNAASDVTCNISTYAVSPAGVYKDSNKESLSATFLSSTGSALSTKGAWGKCAFTVTNTTDHPYLYIRFSSQKTDLTGFYIDNLTIIDVTEESDVVTLVENGISKEVSLAAGAELPILEPYVDGFTGSEYSFDGWYDSTITTKYTTVSADVSTYYAKYTNFTKVTFETGGIFDPNNCYHNTSGDISSWYREIDPTDPNNIVLRANLTNNANNTHFAISGIDGASEGYKLTSGNHYIVSFKYYIKTTDNPSTIPSLGSRGAAKNNIGKSGGKTEAYSSGSMTKLNQWDSASFKILAKDDCANCPYLIFLCQGFNYYKDFHVYIDDVIIREFEEEVLFYAAAYDVTLNDNGNITTGNYDVFTEIPDPKGYYGATFEHWYNESFHTPYTTIQQSNDTYYAKYNGEIINFENGGIFDPNDTTGNNNLISPHVIVPDPTNSTNNVIKIDLTNNNNNTHFALNKSGYDTTDGYKMTPGNTYEISFKYYAESLSSNGVSIGFMGCNSANIGSFGGKSESFGVEILNTLNAWTGVTIKFSYTADIDDHYLIMLAQDTAYNNPESCVSVIYLDDIVIKETVPTKTYTKNTGIKIGGKSFSGQFYTLNIVIPSTNFPYIATMQCNELVTAIKGISNFYNVKIVKESNWNESSFLQRNIFVGDISKNPSDSTYKIDTSSFTEDDYAYRFGNGNIYVNGGSTYALAMAVSELTKQLESASANQSFAAGTTVTGKYSEKQGNYSTASYYRPTFLEDFEGEDIDTNIWNEVNGDTIASIVEGKQSTRSAEHTYLENGNLVIEAAFDDKMYYGGMLRSRGKMEYLYGYLEVSCITPHGDGLWTSIWATSDNFTGAYWSEVDLNESYGNSQKTAFNMHSWPSSVATNLNLPQYTLDNKCSGQEATAPSGTNFNDGFHTFGYLWTPTSATFTVDGMVQFFYDYDDNPYKGARYDNDYDAFNERLSLIISMTVANPAMSNQTPDETGDYWQKSNKYIIDYVHIYQIDGQEIYFTPPTE